MGQVINVAMALVVVAAGAVEPPAAFGPVPSSQQLAWQEMEYGMFCHFGVNTFYDQEWGHGTEDPARFAPTEFSARQWVETAKASGMNYLVVTAKHHDGFCLFPSEYTEHSIKISPLLEGNGDVVKAVADACHELGVMFGFYLSPWDRHEPAYADSVGYDIYFKNQLRELLTNYGKVGEVWFDGAGSAGHEYDWPGYYALIRELQPEALVAICGPDIRWVGNEDGLAPETHWNVWEQDGKPTWYPSECDVPIRKGHWFWATNSEDTIRTLDELLEIYYRSVGRGAVLLLNVAPDTTGQLPQADVSRLKELWEAVSSTYAVNLAEGKAASGDCRGGDATFGAPNMLDGKKDTYWATDDGVTAASVEIDLGGLVTFNRSMIQEHIALGQRVEGYTIEAWDGAAWKPVVAGTTIGYKRLDRFDEVTASKVRLTITQSKACPVISEFGLYRATKE